MKTTSIAVVTTCCALLTPGSTQAEVRLRALSVVIDKPGYNTNYSVGVQAYVDPTSDPINAITVSHEPDLSGSLGTWALSPLPQIPNAWWNWADGRPEQSAGSLDGQLAISLTDASGHTTVIHDYQFQPSVELAMPTMSVSASSNGFHVTTEAVPNADYYNLWLWDPVDRRYPSSQQVSNISDLQDVSFAGLVNGRTYSLYLIANNRFSGGSLDTGEASVFRAYSQVSLTFAITSVPEQSSAVMLGVGILLLITRNLYRASQAVGRKPDIVESTKKMGIWN